MALSISSSFIVALLGVLSVISPFAIDMYLPAFVQIAQEFSVTTSAVALTMSSYFIGLASGQVIYGPLMDRFGRKTPLLVGLSLFIIASIGCAVAPSMPVLILLRFIQGLGGCAASVGSLAMVRDFFPVELNARILSRLFLFISVSPLLAPTTGGMASLYLGWRSVFIILLVIVAIIFALVYFLLPEAHKPDRSIILRPSAVARVF